MLFMTFPYFQSGYEGSRWSANALFHMAAWPFYAFLYLLPVFLLSAIIRYLPGCDHWASKAMALLVTSACLVFIWADGFIFELYSFHINRFVLNLVLTDGGIDSLNNSTGTNLSIAVVVTRIFIIQCIALFLALRQHPLFERYSRPDTAYISAFFLGLFFIQGTTYGISDVANKASVLEHAYDYPWFQKIRFRSLAAKLGYEASARGPSIERADDSRLQYPLHNIAFAEVETPPNIVWLVAESLRWDQLTPEVMPNTWAFAQDSLHYLNHYSSGNGTREGMFGMFYGLYGSYWDSFLHAQQSPLLMDRLQALDYKFDFRTGAKFTYPEFDRTILANLPADTFHEADHEITPWRRDQENTSAMLAFLQDQDSGPFMTFQFFESTHAPYFFPDDEAIREPYPASLNYADFSKEYLQENVGGILNRYSNAAHWVDSQIGRIIETLAQQDRLDNTIVIITGDHGEEFMEKGSWGHNSSFVEEQTHVPMVLKLPGKMPEQVSQLTSHLDIATTMLQYLGAPANIRDYSLGISLLDRQPRQAINISDWHSIAVVTNDMKIRIPYISIGFDNWQPTDVEDHELDARMKQELLSHHQRAITTTIANTSLFTQNN
jgi:membrane-anchored protein YejM (alkaline phosphatase superfamily)